MTFRGACGGAGLHCTPCLFLDNELRSVFTFFFFFFLPLLVYRFGKDLLIPDLSLKAENPQLQLLQYYKCIFFSFVGPTHHYGRSEGSVFLLSEH